MIHHPLITPIGRIRATFLARPARWTTSTTRLDVLVGAGCSSARPFQLRRPGDDALRGQFLVDPPALRRA